MSNDDLIDEFSGCLWDEGHHSKSTKEEFKDKLRALLASSDKDKLKDVLVFLLRNFKYYSLIDVNKSLIMLYQQLQNNLGGDDADFLLTYLKKSNTKTNSSVDFAVSFKTLNGIPQNLFVVDIIGLKEYWEHIQRIVIVDDCCGTGGSLKDFIMEVKRKGLDFSNKTLFYLVIHRMQGSMPVLAELEKEGANFKIECIAVNTTQKAFNAHEIRDTKDSFNKFSAKKGINESLVFGYDDSQAIFAFYNNTPNNTLGIFHAFSKGKNDPLFSRKVTSRLSPWELEKMKKEREGMRANKVFINELSKNDK